ncbi:MAG: hypothetical protein D6685_13180 [Bacteroidetes bacterium]|nr:MAG: hypothetical protein D6685_13180 [Bacteroidota bacterium]
MHPRPDLETLRRQLFARIGRRDGEKWRPVVTPDFTSLHYMVSSHGRVVSLPRFREGPHGPRIWKGRLLKASAQPSGHRRVTIMHEAKPHQIHVHRLVLWAFVGPEPPEAHVRHLDGDPGNNALENLAYVSPWQQPSRTPGLAFLPVTLDLRRRMEAAARGAEDARALVMDLLKLLPSPSNHS